MPMYEVLHSYPLTKQQIKVLASSITKLHATTFTTPSIFVHVSFKSHDASELTYFVAGEHAASTNRITGMVRTSDKRSKAQFDELAGKIEEAWYDALYGEKADSGDSKEKGKRPGEADLTQDKKEAAELLAVVFYPMYAAREKGITIPEAGGDVQWLKDNKKWFQEQADSKGDEGWKGMLEELETREDLKELKI